MNAVPPRRERLAGWIDCREGATTAGPASLALQPFQGQGARGALGAGHGSTAADGAVAAAVVGHLDAAAAGADPARFLVEQYRRAGADALVTLTGEFAAAVLDLDAGCAWLATDRMGRQPLVFAAVEGRLMFASDSRLVLEMLDQRPGLCPQGLYAYLFFHMVPAPYSVHQGLVRLPAAHRLAWRQGDHHLERYWTPDFAEDPAAAPGDTEVFQALQQAVAGRAGPGPCGAFLSGGLDSSTVAGFLARAREDAPTFSIGFDAPGYDEMEYARIASRHFGTRSHEYYVTPDDVAEAFPRVAADFDEPFGNSSVVPAYFCARMAAEHGITTLLAGDGGDELFAGNERYLKQGVFEMYQRLPRLLRGLLTPALSALPQGVPLLSKVGSYVRQASVPLPDRLQTYNFLRRHDPAEILHPDLLAAIDPEAPLALMGEIYRAPAAGTPLKRMLYLDWQHTLADNDLRKVRRACELGGVEVRFPMLDDRLTELAARVPSAELLKPRRLRAYYKGLVGDLLPREILNKSKHGFGLPFGVWLREHPALRELAHERLAALDGRQILRPGFAEEAQRLHAEGHAAYYGELVWILVALETWLEAQERG